MKKLFPLIVLALIAFAFTSDENKFTDNSNTFAINLYQKLSKGNDQNMILSPYSIAQAVAMTYDGAANKTKDQMQKVMLFPKNEERVGKYYASLNKGLLVNSDTVNLQLSNALWPQKDYPFLQSYLDLTTQNYNAPISFLDFKKSRNRKNAVKEINQWVDNNTNGNIKELISPNDVNKNTRLILTNAIWFKADWQLKFDAKRTKNGLFTNINKSQSEVPLMHLFKEQHYYENEDIQALKLPYKGDKLKMVIILPKDTDAFLTVEENLTWEGLSKINQSMRKVKVDLLLPKFKMDSELQLKKTFQAMGMSLAFSDTADFSGMTGNTKLKIDKIIHKAQIEVSEEGTEASAATAVVMIRKTAYIPPTNFHANHPFIFYILDEEHSHILFMGRFVTTN